MAKKTRENDTPASTPEDVELQAQEAKSDEIAPDSVIETASVESASETIEGEVKSVEESVSPEKIETAPEAPIIEGESKVVEEKAPPLKENPPPSNKKDKKTPKSGGASTGMWLLMWVLLGAVAYLGWDSKNSSDSLKENINAVGARVNEAQDARAQVQALSDKFGQDQSAFDSRLKALEGSDAPWKAQIEEELKRLTQAQESLNVERERFLKLQEGSALIGVFQRVIAAEQALASNPEWSLRLLKSAQIRLKAQTDVESQKLLLLVEDDIARLGQQKDKPNFAKMLTQLDDLAKKSASWPLKHRKVEKKPASTVEKMPEPPKSTDFSVESAGEWMKDSAYKLWLAFGDFVRVQSVTETDLLAATGPSWLVYENTRLRFLGLRLALVALNEELFGAELDEMLNAIARDFDVTDATVRSAQKTLKGMLEARFGRATSLKSSAYLMSVPAEVLP